jgi:hypothetical protein
MATCGWWGVLGSTSGDSYRQIVKSGSNLMFLLCIFTWWHFRLMNQNLWGDLSFDVLLCENWPLLRNIPLVWPFAAKGTVLVGNEGQVCDKASHHFALINGTLCPSSLRIPTGRIEIYVSTSDGIEITAVIRRHTRVTVTWSRFNSLM